MSNEVKKISRVGVKVENKETSLQMEFSNFVKNSLSFTEGATNNKNIVSLYKGAKVSVFYTERGKQSVIENVGNNYPTGKDEQGKPVYPKPLETLFANMVSVGYFEYNPEKKERNYRTAILPIKTDGHSNITPETLQCLKGIFDLTATNARGGIEVEVLKNKDGVEYNNIKAIIVDGKQIEVPHPQQTQPQQQVQQPQQAQQVQEQPQQAQEHVVEEDVPAVSIGEEDIPF